MKRIIIVHGWSGNPHKDWMQWLKKHIPKEYDVLVPAMPNTDEPVIEDWVEHLRTVAGSIDKETYFIGHSIGCQAILRLIERENNACGGCLFVAGWFHLNNLEEDSVDIAQPWLETPIDFKTAKKNIGKAIALFSDDDPYVPVSDAELFKRHLGCEIVIVHGREHFNESEEPAVLEQLEKILQRKVFR